MTDHIKAMQNREIDRLMSESRIEIPERESNVYPLSPEDVTEYPPMTRGEKIGAAAFVLAFGAWLVFVLWAPEIF